MKRIAVVLVVALFSACGGDSNINTDFVKKYGNENFKEFENTTLFVRSGDRAGGLIIFAYDYKVQADSNNGAYVIIIDIKKKKIKSTACDLMKDSTLSDKRKLEKLALLFIGYSTAYLSVDSVNNVSICLRMNKRPDLVRFSALKYKSSKYSHWKQIKDNWFEDEED